MNVRLEKISYKLNKKFVHFSVELFIANELT